MATGDLYDLQERYVLLFDRTRSLSLHLFEHVHGESRDRGQAMVDLKTIYENGGLEIAATELPDFVPLFLEFLSTQPRAGGLRSAGPAGPYFRGDGGAAAQTAVGLRGRVPRAGAACGYKAEGATSCRPCWPSPIRTPTTLRRSMPPGRTRRSSSGRAPASDCKDTLIEKIRAGRRPAPGMPQAQARPVMPRS